MKQLTQRLKDGKMEVLEVPPPMLGPGMVLVHNHFSLISAGTEGSTVGAARKNLIGKAMDRPHQVKQALDVVKQQGPVQAYRAVMKKLDSYSPLGYSSAGVVLDIAPDVKAFHPGDKVACAGGGYANHAEVIAVPVNLCVKLSPEADLKKAAYNTLGAIALQGVRQADLTLGETCVVIGLGLLGQLACLLLHASGVKVIGVDIDSTVVDIANAHAADIAFTAEEPGLIDKVYEFTDGIGADSVIITAASPSTEPVNLAGRLLRRKGRVVVVGDVPTGFEREPDYYKKELELRMSCSYGPGRYDPQYEAKGLDYPIGYVRWTEGRNMMAFQEFVHSGKLDLDFLSTHVFKLEEASKAYDMIMERKELFLGILIEYDTPIPNLEKKIVAKSSVKMSRVNISFIGAGSYATGNLLPHIPKIPDVTLNGVMASSGTSARTVADKYGFAFCTSDERDILEAKDTDTVFIATRHDTHTSYVLKSLRAGKHVYVEKPLCLRSEELEEISQEYNQQHVQLMVGFNRRFAPLTAEIQKQVGKGPMAMQYRVSAGAIPADNWIQDPEVGGGRIIGEVCHFVDLMTFLNGSSPVLVHAAALNDPEGKEDTVIINLQFKNGSVGSIQYFANGSKNYYKEHIEVYRSGMTAVLRDFRELEIYSSRKTYRKKLLAQDKGQKVMLHAFIDALKHGRPAPIPFHEIYATTITTFKAVESLRIGKALHI